MTDPDWLAARFEDHRPHLRSVAYRMLGSLAEAEDTVQDAWLRASRANAAEVENLGGWLTTIVALSASTGYGPDPPAAKTSSVSSFRIRSSRASRAARSPPRPTPST